MPPNLTKPVAVSQMSPRRLPDDSQTTPRRLPDVSPTSPRRLGDVWETSAEYTVQCTVQQSGGSGRTIRPGCDEPLRSAPKALAPSSKHYYRAQEVYPLSPLLRGGFQRRGGVSYHHESEFLTVFTNEPSGVSGRNCPTRILLVWEGCSSGVTDSFGIGGLCQWSYGIFWYRGSLPVELRILLV